MNLFLFRENHSSKSSLKQLNITRLMTYIFRVSIKKKPVFCANFTSRLWTFPSFQCRKDWDRLLLSSYKKLAYHIRFPPCSQNNECWKNPFLKKQLLTRFQELSIQALFFSIFLYLCFNITQRTTNWSNISRKTIKRQPLKTVAKRCQKSSIFTENSPGHRFERRKQSRGRNLTRCVVQHCLWWVQQLSPGIRWPRCQLWQWQGQRCQFMNFWKLLLGTKAKVMSYHEQLRKKTGTSKDKNYPSGKQWSFLSSRTR